MSFTLFVAKKLYKSTQKKDKRGASKLALRIATAGVAIGLAVMIISICVVKGFQTEVRSKLSGFTAHMEVLSLASFASPEDHPIAVSQNYLDKVKSIEGISHVDPVSLKMGIIKTDDAFQTIVLKGVNEKYASGFIERHFVEGRKPRFSETEVSNEVLISRKQAQNLHIKVGDKIFAYFISNEIRMRRFKVVGIYETSLMQFDEHFVWTDRAAVNKLNNWTSDKATDIEVRLGRFEDIEKVQPLVKFLSKDYRDANGGNYEVLSVKENPRTAAVTQWLSLLDLNVWVILALMMGVAGFTMVSGLLILILERTSTIGVLKALGATNRCIRHIFIEYAAFILIRGLVWGNIVGLGIVLLQKYFAFVKLDPSTYYVEAAPVEISVLWIVAINLVTLLLTTLTMVVPSYITSNIRPTKAIRFE